MSLTRPTTILLLSLAMSAFGGTNTWTTSGPKALQAWNVSADPTDSNVLFVQTNAGMYRTTDGGSSWVSANEGSDGGVTWSIWPAHPCGKWAPRVLRMS